MQEAKKDIIPKVEADSPFRCQARVVGSSDQCHQKVMPGFKYCLLHNKDGVQRQERKNLSNYRLGKYQRQLEELNADENAIKSLRDEVGILRIILQEIFDKINNDATASLLMYSSQISDLVSKVESTVSSCQKLELTSGQYLDKQQATALMTQIIQIIQQNIFDDELREKIASELLALINRKKVHGTALASSGTGPE